MIEVIIINLLLAIVLALGLHGSLNLVARLSECTKRGTINRYLATLLRIVLATVMGGAAALLPTTLWTTVEAYGSAVGVLTFFAVGAPAVVIAIIDFSRN